VDNSTTLAIVAVWLFFALVVGAVARSLGRSAITWIGVSALVSPLLGIALLLWTDRENPRRSAG
jgi:hypothetical protein